MCARYVQVGVWVRGPLRVLWGVQVGAWLRAAQNLLWGVGRRG